MTRQCNHHVQWTIAAALAAACGCGGTEVEQLAAELTSADRDTRRHAAKALEEYGPEAQAAVDQLAAGLRDVDPKVRYRCAKALSKVGFGALGAADAVVAALPEADADTRYYLVKTLANMEDAAAPSVAQLAEILQNDPDSGTRYYAAKALGKIGREAREAAPALEAASRDADERVRRAATEAVAKVI